MKKGENIPHKFETLSDLHRVLGLPKPLHPLISLVENKDNEIDISKLPGSFIHDFYKISYKKNLTGKIKYGQKQKCTGRTIKSHKPYWSRLPQSSTGGRISAV